MTYYDIHTHHQPTSTEVVALVNIMVSEDSARNLHDKKPLFCSVGIHPWYIKDEKVQLVALKRMLSFPNVIALGEIGLDKYADRPIEEQLSVFRQQALWAEEKGKFLIVHCVKAWDELIALKKEIQPQKPWVIHGFRGNAQLAQQLIRQGCYLSFGKHFNTEAVRAAWPEHVFVETDDSVIDIRAVYASVSDVLGVSMDTFASQIAENVRKILLFPL